MNEKKKQKVCNFIVFPLLKFKRDKEDFLSVIIIINDEIRNIMEKNNTLDTFKFDLYDRIIMEVSLKKYNGVTWIQDHANTDTGIKIKDAKLLKDYLVDSLCLIEKKEYLNSKSIWAINSNAKSIKNASGITPFVLNIPKVKKRDFPVFELDEANYDSTINEDVPDYIFLFSFINEENAPYLLSIAAYAFMMQFNSILPHLDICPNMLLNIVSENRTRIDDLAVLLSEALNVYDSSDIEYPCRFRIKDIEQIKENRQIEFKDQAVIFEELYDDNTGSTKAIGAMSLKKGHRMI